MTENDSYLDAMGITQWQSREEMVIAEEPAVLSSVAAVHTISGLHWLSQGSKNGLLVVLPQNRRDLNSEQRSLMSKMLKSIDFPPKDTGFVTVFDSSTITDKPSVSLEGIRAILALGQEAGAALVQRCGAKNINGTDLFSLNGINMVCTLHPEDLLEEPSLKQQAWNDLIQLSSFIKKQS